MFKFSKAKLYNVMQGNFDILYQAFTGNDTSHKWLASVTLLLFIEYALKYKIQNCGRKFRKNHTIKQLYDELPTDDQETIKENFESIRSLANARGHNFSKSIGALLDKYNKEYTFIRYSALEDIEVNREFPYLEMLVVFMAIINSTDIKIQVRFSEIYFISDTKFLENLFPKI